VVAVEGMGHDDLMFPFSNTILLRGIGHGNFMFDATLGQILAELPRYVFSTIVTAKTFDTVPRLSLHPWYKLLEVHKYFRLGAHEVDQGVVGKVISEDNKVEVAGGGGNVDRASHIRMYEFSWGGSMMCSNWEGGMLMFSHDAGCAMDEISTIINTEE
jgi:hypothetical protein